MSASNLAAWLGLVLSSASLGWIVTFEVRRLRAVCAYWRVIGPLIESDIASQRVLFDRMKADSHQRDSRGLN